MLTNNQHVSMRNPGTAILINYPGYPSSIDSLMPDNGLANLAGSLKRENWKVLILDYANTDIFGRLVPSEMRKELVKLFARYSETQKLDPDLASEFQKLNQQLYDHALGVQKEIAQEIISKVREMDALFVGFKLWTGAGQEGSLNIATHIKTELPEIKIFGGGPHAECFGSCVLKELQPAFDVIALGEGEKTIIDLAEFALGKKDLFEIPGIAYWEDEQKTEIRENPVESVKDLNTLSDPVYDPKTYPAMEGDSKLKLVMIDESRGCPFSCNFCFHPVKSGRGWRVRDTSSVINMMESISRTTGASCFRLSGSNPPPDYKNDLASEMIKRGSPFEYISFGHTRSEDEDYALLRKSGLVSLFFGVESGSQSILDKALNKKTKVEGIRKNFSEASKAGIMTSASLIVPCPFDTQETLQETVDLVSEIKPDGVSIYLPIITPRTEWYTHPKKYEIEFEGDIFQTMMSYQVRFLMPPPMWDPLPYVISGRTYPEMVGAAQRVTVELEKRNILTGSNDSLLMLGRKINRSPQELRQENRSMFMTADQTRIKEIVKEFNQSR
ncbi:B12-binding domain-containing radical SAM protein [Planctomycetota bacterium]